MTDATVAVPLETTPAEANPAPSITLVSDGYRRYAMVVLLLIYILNFVDRQVINILAEPIKNELGLMDWQLGLLTGLAFAIFYTVLGLPIARIAETRSRPAIIALSLAVWSGFTAACGLAQSFFQLVLARIGVGVGEAGCTPAAHSLIADYVPKENRASALAFYSMGTPLGSLVGLAVGGLVADAYGWRMAFIVCGAPGVLFALIAAFTLIEPRVKKAVAAVKVAAAPKVTYREALTTLASKRTFRLVAIAAAVKAFIGYGHAPFTASFFFRNHTEEVAALAADFGLKSGGFLGLALGISTGLGGALGAFLGGQIADRFGKRDIRAWMSVPAIAALVNIPIYMLAMMSGSAVVVLSVFALNAVLASLWYGPVYATAQSIAPVRTRATASAVMLFVINLIGLGLGPLVVGAMSDLFAHQLDLGAAEGVRWALIVSSSFGLIAFGCFWAARRSIAADMES
jgi:MFS family permease